MKIFSPRISTRLGAALAAAGLLAIAGCTSSGSSSSSTASSSPASPGSASAPAAASAGSPSSASAAVPAGTLSVKQLAYATTLKHSFQPNGKGAVKTESLSQPDDIVTVGGNLYVGFQDGVGSQGEPSTSNNLDSTLVEFTKTGSVVKQWDLKGKIDGLGADPANNRVFVTVNEDANSSLYTVAGGTVTHYAYTPALPHKGGTDAVSVYNGKILISASAPGTSGKAPAAPPAVYAVTLNAGSKTAVVKSLFSDTAAATVVGTGTAGKKVTLALSDGDSNSVVPATSPAFGGDFMLDSQGDLELIFSGPAGANLKVLKISNSVDDSAWATSATGTLYITDSGANTIDAVTGTFTSGTMYTSVTPCNANSAPANCPSGKYTANYLGTINLKTGAISPVTVVGPPTPKGMIFVP
ncbi:MAG TPA: hypothetical protein VGD91_30570 [Trebonia sp.]